eukprot:TRINITY_DN12436_c0_g1_i12.p1 TRINITY_DN12436_c0_g1~~TRINITY_DN12436_c0_g1_i12.p1  ORF type:complete len:825 (+),score=140.63 TRINITY_DN12436_c0_g1_i12:95-2569(+)
MCVVVSGHAVGWKRALGRRGCSRGPLAIIGTFVHGVVKVTPLPGAAEITQEALAVGKKRISKECIGNVTASFPDVSLALLQSCVGYLYLALAYVGNVDIVSCCMNHLKDLVFSSESVAYCIWFSDGVQLITSSVQPEYPCAPAALDILWHIPYSTLSLKQEPCLFSAIEFAVACAEKHRGSTSLLAQKLLRLLVERTDYKTRSLGHLFSRVAKLASAMDLQQQANGSAKDDNSASLLCTLEEILVNQERPAHIVASYLLENPLTDTLAQLLCRLYEFGQAGASDAPFLLQHEVVSSLFLRSLPYAGSSNGEVFRTVCRVLLHLCGEEDVYLYRHWGHAPDAGAYIGALGIAELHRAGAVRSLCKVVEKERDLGTLRCDAIALGAYFGMLSSGPNKELVCGSFFGNNFAGLRSLLSLLDVSPPPGHVFRSLHNLVHIAEDEFPIACVPIVIRKCLGSMQNSRFTRDLGKGVRLLLRLAKRTNENAIQVAKGISSVALLLQYRESFITTECNKNAQKLYRLCSRYLLGGSRSDVLFPAATNWPWCSRLPLDVWLYIAFFLHDSTITAENRDDNQHWAVNLMHLSHVSRFFYTGWVKLDGLSISEHVARCACREQEASLHYHHGWIFRLHQLESREDYLYATAFSVMNSVPEKQREWARDQILKLFDEFDVTKMRNLQEPSISCVSGDAQVLLADGNVLQASLLRVGDKVRTELGSGRVTCIYRGVGLPSRKVVRTPHGFHITRFHPIKLHGEWVHPSDVFPIVALSSHTELLNFELAPEVKGDHALWCNGLLCCTLGKDVGSALRSKRPDLDDSYGVGYWHQHPAA